MEQKADKWSHPASRSTPGGYLWLLDCDRTKPTLATEFQEILDQLKPSKVPTQRDAESAAVAAKLKTEGLLADESPEAVGLIKRGVEVAGFMSLGDLIWIVQINRLRSGVTQEAWVNSRTGARPMDAADGEKVTATKSEAGKGDIADITCTTRRPYPAPAES